MFRKISVKIAFIGIKNGISKNIYHYACLNFRDTTFRDCKISVKLRCAISGLLMPWQVNMRIVTQLVSLMRTKMHSWIFASYFELADCRMSTVISWMRELLVDSELDYA